MAQRSYQQPVLRRALTFLLSVALTAMIAGQLPVAISPGGKCDLVADSGSCCDHSKPGDRRAPAGASCATCCLACCIIVAPSGIEVVAPVATAIQWSPRRFVSVSRTEKPPLPPPRLG